MKKLIVLGILLTIITTSIYSQTEKKTLLLGGHANVSFLSLTESLYINLNPNTGVFITDKFCLGLSIPVVYLSEQFYWGMAPFARYHFKPQNTRSFYLSASTGLTGLFELENTLTDNILNLGAGHVWFVGKNTGLEVEFIGSTDFEGIDFGVYVGFQIYLGRTKVKAEK